MNIGWTPPSNVLGSHSWLDCSEGYVPDDAVPCGVDKDGGHIYIGRALHQGDILPCKVCPRHGCAFAGYDGAEIRKLEYQVLCSDSVAWALTRGSKIPSQAIQVGSTSNNEPLFVGRTLVDGFLTPGKVHPSHNCLYVPYEGEERSYTEYEILIAY